jgi:site-specific recombinase XerD
MNLASFVRQYAAGRDVSDRYVDQLRWFVSAWEHAEGRTLTLDDLNLDAINRHLRSTRERLSPETRKSRRRMALTLWQAAADELLLPEPPRRKVMAIRVPDKLQHAWTLDQVRLLLRATDRLRGFYQGGLRRREYWRSYVLAAWDTGLRGCDLRRVEFASIQPTGQIVLIQHKTGRRHEVRLSATALAAVQEHAQPARKLVWPLWGRLERWRREAQALVRKAGLTGSIGQLRHSSGTAVELANPGHGHEFLGNTRAVFERHYLDRTLLPSERPRPPAL